MMTNTEFNALIDIVAAQERQAAAAERTATAAERQAAAMENLAEILAVFYDNRGQIGNSRKFDDGTPRRGY